MNFLEIAAEIKNYKRTHEDFLHSTYFLSIEDISGFLATYEDKCERIFVAEELRDKVVLILAENGYGDSIILWRYIKKIASIAKEVYFIVPDLLIPLLQKDLDNNKHVILSSKIPEVNYDNMLYLFDLYYMFKNEHKPLGRYLQVNKVPLGNSSKIKVGLAFGNSDTEIGMMYRNIPHKYSRYFKGKNIELYNFCNYKSAYINVREKCKDFLDAARIVQEMDYIICADNVMLNLAGALGVKTFALFNKEYEWIWFDLNDNNVGWYSSVKPYVCEKENDWLKQILKIKNNLMF